MRVGLQRGLRVAYLGPRATYAHQAAIQQFGQMADLIPAATIDAIFDLVAHAGAEFGVVPVENSNEGVVSHTLDLFVDSPLTISAEIHVAVHHDLLSSDGIQGKITDVYSHPQALAQCRRWLELNLFSGRNFPPDRYPAFETLMTERDNLFKAHPKTRFVAAHLGWHGADLARLGRMFDAMPNLYAELGAVLYELGRQPRFAHDFLVKYSNRVLFGKDAYEPSEYPYYWRVLETKDDYFDYYRDYHAFWKLYGMGLPDPVLRKVYAENARRVIKGLAQAK